jgi:hypothetical protein
MTPAKLVVTLTMAEALIIVQEQLALKFNFK